ncbi:MAG: hypothetical protein WC645_08615, partial [Candidatus Margulisiibacteriota bacterium]
FNGLGILQYGDGSNFTIRDDGTNNIFKLTGASDLLEFGNAADNNAFTFLGNGTFTINTNGTIQANSATTLSATALTTLNLATANGSAAAINIGTSYQANNVGIGSTAGAGSLTLRSGTGGTTMNSTGATTLTTGTTLGLTSTGSTTLTSGDDTTVSVTDIFDLDAATVNLDGSTAINIGTALDRPLTIQSSTFDIDSSGNFTLDTSGVASIALTTTNANIALSTSTGNNNVTIGTGTGDFNINSGQMIVDGNGNITLAPSSSTLTITAATVNSTTTTALNLGAATVDFNGLGILQYGDGSNFTIRDDSSNNIVKLTGASDLMEFGNATDNNAFTFLGNGTYTINTNGTVQANSATTFSATALTTLNLATANSSAAVINIGTSYQANNVGIGSTAGAGSLTLRSGTNGMSLATTGSTTLAASNAVSITASNAINMTAGAASTTNITGTLLIDSTGTLSLNTTNNANIITGSGNFGIGTTNPGYDLEVIGDGRFSSNLTIGAVAAPTLYIGAAGSASGYAFQDTSYTNLLSNASFETDGDANGLADQWTNSGLAAYSQSATSLYNTFSQLATADAAGDHLYQSVADFANYKAKYVTASVWVRLSGVAETAQISIYDGVGTSSQTITTSASWQRLYVTRLVDAAASELTFRLYPATDGAGSALFDGALLQEGRVLSQFALKGGDFSSIGSDLIPAVDNTYNLGSAALRWKDLWLGPASLKITSTTGTAGSTDNYTLGKLSFTGTNLKLGTSIVGAGVTGSLQLTTGNNTGINVDSSGNVGVGTTNPLAKLHVEGQCVALGTKIKRRRKGKNGEWVDPTSPEGFEGLGEEIPVEDIVSGDEVLTLDEKTGEFIYQTVEKTMDKGVQTTFHLTTEDGKEIRTTAEHPYLVRVPKIHQNSNFLHDATFGMVKEAAERYYFDILCQEEIRCPALDDEIIEIGRDGWNHLLEKERSNLELMSRFFALPKLKTVLAKGELISRKPVVIKRDGKIKEYWAIQARVDRFLIKAVIQSVNGCQKHFLSVVWKGEDKKMDAVSRLYPRCQAFAFSVKDIYNTLVDALSRACFEQKWIKVRFLKQGMAIAVENDGKLEWQKIKRIKKFGREQVYDLQI